MTKSRQLFLFLLALAGCGGDGDTVANLDPTLTSIQTNVFNKSCALVSCHNSTAAQGGLKLTQGDSFGEIVNIAAENSAAAADGKLRVVPGDPGASFLIQKLEGPGAGEGDLMPQSSSGLDSEIIAVIRQWIADGALNN